MSEARLPSFPPVAGPLLDWYDRNKRAMPWRDRPDPYRVWVSEIMLQQTRVEAVIPYFERFLAAFPDVVALAAAPLEQVLKSWEGLGYYSRANHLHQAARTVVDLYGGQLPDDPAALLQLPGIGPYTAGAILSIAFGRPEPAVDGNVLRVSTRLMADATEIGSTCFAKQVADKIRPQIPFDRPGDFTQALMELGACICLPGGAARCVTCPLSTLCLAYRNGNPEDYPVRKAARVRKVEVRTAFVVTTPDGILLRRRPERGLLAGLWEFPHVEGRLDEEEARRTAVLWGASVPVLRALPERTHVFTHLEWPLSGWQVCASSCAIPDGWTLATAEELRDKYPLPSAFIPWLDQLGDCGMMGVSESDGRQDP